MSVGQHWRKERGPRVQGSRDLDRWKVQAPCIVRLPSGGYRLFYTAVGPAKPYATCQGYLLSAVSEDGLAFEPEPGIRLSPNPTIPEMALRALAPSVARTNDGRWRMYFESRGPAERPTVIRSAVSADLLDWEHERGVRLEAFDGVGGPRYLPLSDGRGRLYCFASEVDRREAGGERRRQSVISAVSSDGLAFELESGYRLRDGRADYDTAGVTAAEVISPRSASDRWTMYFSPWQDVPPGTVVPPHPSLEADAISNGLSEDFAAASIAADMAGYRSRIYTAHSSDGLTWEVAGCAIEGGGHDSDELDAVHAEDMSLVKIGDEQYRMYYAACDRAGNWRIASAVGGPH